jgi:AraC-like DNA-binding protein
MADNEHTSAARVERGLWPTGSATRHEILAAAQPPEVRGHIVAALRGVADVRLVSSLAGLEDSQTGDAPLLGLVYLDGQGAPADTDRWMVDVQRFRERWTAVPVIAYAPCTAEAMRQCLRAGHAGISEIAIRGIDNLAHVLGPMLERRSAQPIIRDIIGEVIQARGRLTHEALRVLRHCLDHLRDGLTVRTLADGVGVSPRTVANHLAAGRLPTPERLIMWARLLALAWLLRDEQCSVNHAAHILGGDAGGGSLRSLAARYLGHPPEWLRGPAGVGNVVRAMGRPPLVRSNAPLAGSDTILRAE